MRAKERQKDDCEIKNKMKIGALKKKGTQPNTMKNYERFSNPSKFKMALMTKERKIEN